MFDNQRPGVYSRYDITGFYSHSAGTRDAALILRETPVQSGSLHCVTSYAEAVSLFGDNPDGCLPLECMRLLFFGGAGKVYAASRSDGCAEALALLEGKDNIGAVVCDFRDGGDLALLRDFVEKSAGDQRECIAFLGLNDPEEAISAAETLNCERVALCCPAADTGEGLAPDALFAACALAARVLGAPSPIHNLGGGDFPLLRGVQPLPEDTVQRLLRAGVCVFEEIGGEAELIRALTTRTRTSGIPDGSLRSLNTILIIDDVMKSIRLCLRQRLRGTGTASVSSIRDQIAVELASKVDEGILSGFETPRVSPDKTDPAICAVELSFSAAHLPSRIHITAHVRV